MSEMVERVAAAIQSEHEKAYGKPAVEGFGRSMHLASARAAIEAMREPVCNAIHCGCANYCDFDEAEDKIRSLFDAALKE